MADALVTVIAPALFALLCWWFGTGAILWLVRNHPELKDAQIMRLVGTTKTTIQQIRDRTHWNAATLAPIGAIFSGPPLGLGMGTAGLVLAIMVIPFTSSVAREVLKSVPVSHLNTVLTDGAGFAGFAIWGMGMGPHGPDYMAVGDPTTLSLMPWMPGYARIACDGHVNGKPYAYCSRVALKASETPLAPVL